MATDLATDVFALSFGLGMRDFGNGYFSVTVVFVIQGLSVLFIAIGLALESKNSNG
ncbi:MAG: hypothetical protein AAFQ91_33565 [Cyanobacteria bacterium J06621_15]